LVTINVDGGTNDKIVEMDAMKTIKLNEDEDDRGTIQVYMANSNPPVDQDYNLFESPLDIVLGAGGVRVSGFDSGGQGFGVWSFACRTISPTPKLGKVRRTG
jgi:hypothetical protein